MLPKTPSFLSNLATQPTSLQWRSQFQQSQLVSQISSILLQRKHWIQLLKRTNLSSNLTPDHLFQILQNTQDHPQISLDFFNWSKTNLPFKPHLKAHVKIIQILLQSNLHEPANRLFKDIRIQSEQIQISAILNTSIQVSKGNDTSRSLMLSFILENYSKYGSVDECLEVFGKIRSCRCVLSVYGCNSLLHKLQQADNMRLLWCFYGAVTRNGVIPDSTTWVLLAGAFSKEGKVEMAIKLLNSGVSSVGIYNLIVDCYSRKGSFSAAMELLNEMRLKRFKPGFGTYSSILDGACKFHNVGVIDSIMSDMVAKELLPSMPLSDCDSIIHKLCDLGKPYAAYMFFKRARNEKIEVAGCFICVLSREGRLNVAMQVYGMITKRSIAVNDDCYDAFVSLICKTEPTKEANLVLKDVIRKGYLPSALHLSKYLDAQCCKGRWQEAEDLLNVILEKGLLPNGICCRSLVEHYCSHERFDSAIVLHDKVERLGGILDLTSYNLLLDGLCADKKLEEASRVFDCMRKRNVLSSESYSVMIIALCHEKEMRKAMKFHDEMLRKGLQPDDVTYKRLISGFA
ncbi:pentatricopeptide repeat-containing protein [Cinnamomum micranthum f. kanehirae]|uniref:Pentatricopeptide repeat-containing protein n=1 Tax=Cinnamomum micranthum f. kanehirae TaxID=337451 RepID=A0A3S4PC01_9MAGN|nr:pentatricopeptide repeat-containing protein [Cinnamomum micranthum f. kanehirae]